MKHDLPYFSHYNATHNEPRIQALLAEYGYEGYGRYWILCEIIASSQNATLDISGRIIKLTIARTLGLSAEEFDSFIGFLNAPDVKLVKFENGFITTNQLQEDYQRVSKKRERDRVDYNSDNDPSTDLQIPLTETLFPTAENTQSRVDKSRVNKSSSSNEVVFSKQPTTTTFLNFCINNQKAQELCAGLDPSWLSGAFTYPEYIADSILENYPDKPQDQKTRLFVTLFNTEDRKAMFPQWRQEQEAAAAERETRTQKKAAEKEQSGKLEALEKAGPQSCGNCGRAIEAPNTSRGECPFCGYFYFLNKEIGVWEFGAPIHLVEFNKLAG